MGRVQQFHGCTAQSEQSDSLFRNVAETTWREPTKQWARADDGYTRLRSSRLRSSRLECDVEFNVHTRIHRVAQVIHAINVDDINVLRIEPVARPHANKSERIAAVLKVAITVIALVHAKRVSLSKVGFVTVVRNSAGALVLLCRPSFGCALLLLLCVLLLRLGAPLFLFRRLFWLSFLLGRFVFIFLLVVLLLLCVRRSR